MWGFGLLVVVLAALAGSAFATDAYLQGHLTSLQFATAIATLGFTVLAGGFFGVLRPLSRSAAMAMSSCREILDSSADAVFIVGPGSKIEFASQSAARLLGFGGKELVGLPTSHLIDDANAIQNKKDVLMSSQNEVVGLSCDVRVSRKDGVSIPMNLAITETGQGKRKRRIWVLRDLSDVRRMQIELERSEDRFKALAECSPVAVFQIDTYGGLLYCNNKMMGLFGVRREDLVGGGWAEWINPEEREDFLNQLRQATIQGIGFSRELRIIQADRNLSWTRCSFSPLCRNDGSLIGFVGSLEDITEIRVTRESLANSRASIADALDSFNIGFAIWDPEDRLVICNPAYRAHYPEVSHALVAGMPYREVLRTYLEAGGRNPFPSEEAFYTHWTMKLHHTGEPWDIYLQGRKVRTSAARSSSGNTVVLLLDQPEVQQGRDEVYAEALAHLPIGLAVYGEDGRPLAHTPKFFETADVMSRITQVGIQFVEDAGCFVANSITPSGQRICLAAKMAERSDLSSSTALDEALRSLDAGVVVYGPDRKIAFANERMREFFPDLRESLVTGSSPEDILRDQFRSLHLTRLGVEEKDWIQRRLDENLPTGAIDDPNALVALAENGFKLVIHPRRSEAGSLRRVA